MQYVCESAVQPECCSQLVNGAQRICFVLVVEQLCSSGCVGGCSYRASFCVLGVRICGDSVEQPLVYVVWSAIVAHCESSAVYLSCMGVCVSEVWTVWGAPVCVELRWGVLCTFFLLQSVLEEVLMKAKDIPPNTP